MSGVIPDGLRMDPQTNDLPGVQKTEDLKTEAVASNVEPVAGFEPGDLPFTRRREFMLPPCRSDSARVTVRAGCWKTAGRTTVDN